MLILFYIINIQSAFSDSKNLKPAQDETASYTQFETYFFGDPSQGTPKDYTQAYHYLEQCLSLKICQFALSVLQKESYFTSEFLPLSQILSSSAISSSLIQSTTKHYNVLSISLISSEYTCILLKSANFSSIFSQNIQHLFYSPFKIDCQVSEDLAGASILQAYAAKKNIEKEGVSRVLVGVKELKETQGFGEHYEKYLVLKSKSFSGKKHLNDILRTAQMFYYGNSASGVSQNYTKALEFYEKALSLGSKKAATRIGKIYLYGHGVEVNLDKTVKYMEIGVQGKDGEAVRILAYLYEKGLGVKQNSTRAYELANLGVEYRDIQCIYNFGVYTATGIGTEKDPKKGMKYIELAAELGSPAAMYATAMQYYYGDLSPKDYLKSLKLAFGAIHASQEDQYVNLAYKRYKEGDYKGAYLYYLFAANLGYVQAYAGLSYLLKKGLVEDKCKFKENFCLKYYLALGMLGRDSWSFIEMSKLLIKEKSADSLLVLEQAEKSSEKFYYLGYCHEYGIGCKVNYTKALEYYEMGEEFEENSEVEERYVLKLAAWVLRGKKLILTILEFFNLIAN